MQQRSILRRRGFFRVSTRVAAAVAALALVIGGGILGASTATADAPSVSVYADDFGSASAQAEAYLYTMSGGSVTSSIPVDGFDYGESGFEFDGVVAGTYGIAFRDDVSGAWLPWLSHTDGTVADATGGASSCLLTFTLTATDDIDFGSVSLGSAATSTCSAPWGTASTFSGTVSNMPVAGSVSAWLYYVDVADDYLIPVNRSSVSSQGNYSIDGVSLAGQYVVYLEIDDDSPFLDTWSDGTDATSSSQSAPFDAAVTIAEDTDYVAPAIDLVPAAVFSGEVKDASGNPVDGALVEASAAPGQSGGYYSSTVTNSSGQYSLRVKPGVSYVLDVEVGNYAPVYWPDADDVQDAVIVMATAAGAFPTPFDFSLAKNATELAGFVVKIDPSDESTSAFANVTASLYKHTGGYWKKLSTQSAVDVGGLNEFDFSQSDVAALSSGDFRLRFHTPSGWVAVAESESVDMDDPSADPNVVDTPSCFVPISNVEQGEQLIVFAAVDPTDTTTKCADEPQTPSRPRGVTSARIETTAAVQVTSTSTPTPTPTPTAIETATPAPTPTGAATPQSTPAPALTSTTYSSMAWLWWLLGALVVVIVAVIVWLVVRRPRP